jgi:hypothetical protein
MKSSQIHLRPLLLGSLVLGCSALLLAQALAGDKHYYPPVQDPLVKEECGSCHLAFSPAMLPASSWQRMMGELKHHFGDDASLDPQSAQHITAHLVANAADAGRHGTSKLLRGVKLDSAPQRITELPEWVHEHRKVPDWEWRHKEVRSKANCLACHIDAEAGYYDD